MLTPFPVDRERGTIDDIRAPSTLNPLADVIKESPLIRLLALLVLIAWAAPAEADIVVRSDRGVARVVVCQSASSASADVGSLQPGDQAEHLGSVPRWYHLSLGSRIPNTPVALGQGASMTLLHADWINHGSPNDNSLVGRLDLGSTRVLLTGDADAGGRAAANHAPAPASIAGSLVACCSMDLAADILIVGHHGSMTSSRQVFLDAVGATTFIVSSGPLGYGPNQVVLPDQVVIDELPARGTMCRTVLDDAACATNAAKIGPDADDRVGGCDNIRITIPATGPFQIAYFRVSD